MYLQALLASLGKPITDDTVNKAFAEAHIDKEKIAPLPKGEFNTYLEEKSKGIAIVLTDAAMFLGQSNTPIGKGPLYFSGVFLYAGGKEDYAPFTEQLPHNITFKDTRNVLIEKLGEPSWSRRRNDGTLAADRWDEVACYHIHISYFKEAGLPSIITMQIPDKDF